ncbi:DUF2958 domain-containing protein [Sphingomonas sp. NFR15]|uniref:DUF2958 domain-containing protein n=1 Tax=Sphingomonas sp. NFR15 TaxID=1566282 RepID=UPI000891E005|nr:DUF2958 domain-containing protein [Sphingomonas sp. NFR15]SDA25355.1 Protein of unknown function [Sphingomonas sp. NFR15]
MILLTPELHAGLRVNANRSAESDHDPAPAVKFFNPLGAATWLATELYDDDDTLFGLADLGFGCPELGCFSLSELAGIRLSFGLGIERDIGFATTVSLSVWADTARRAGSISQAQSIIWRIESAPIPELPTDPKQVKGG